MGGNLHELLSQGVGVGLKSKKPYDAIWEASIGYAGAVAVAVIDEVAFVNKRQDERIKGICHEYTYSFQRYHMFAKKFVT